MNRRADALDGVRLELGRAYDIAVRASSVALADELYARWWTGMAEPADWPTEDETTPPLPATFRAAHAGSRMFEDGWLVTQSTAAGGLVVSRGDEWRTLDPGDFVNVARPGVPPRPGERIRAVGRRDAIDPESGYWLTWSPAGQPDRPFVRVYWNAPAAGAVSIVRALTETMVDGSVRFQLKCPPSAEGYRRHDAVVLYAALRDWESLRPAVRAAVASSEDERRPSIPPLTFPAASGVGVAADVAPDESLGSVQCRVVAAALLDAIGRGQDRTMAIEHTLDSLAASGAPRGRPWLIGPRRGDFDL